MVLACSKRPSSAPSPAVRNFENCVCRGLNDTFSTKLEYIALALRAQRQALIKAVLPYFPIYKCEFLIILIILFYGFKKQKITGCNKAITPEDCQPPKLVASKATTIAWKYSVSSVS